ncbi:MAG TPA: DUF1800 domain-containing protein, partial [Gemmatimonadaceae bacterium]|nr:DUF1800 domain-containing protein [Gemmatimonadaceae bacterium]
ALTCGAAGASNDSTPSVNPLMRKFHSLLAAGSLALAACGTPATSIEWSPAPANAPREQTADEQVKHALSRLAFGPRPGDVERVRATGVDRWIAWQLEPDGIDDRQTERFLTRYQTLTMSTAELMRAYPPPALLRTRRAAGDSTRRARPSADDSLMLRQARQASRRILAELQTAKVARAVMSERQLEEVMVDFWENHFSVFAGKGPERYFLSSYERDAIRPHAMGRFRDLLESVARSPAMLFYLDNWRSWAEADRATLRPRARRANSRGLNENYARELLELHTLGVDGGYTQQDVINVARAFTGWTLDAPRRGGEGFVFRPQMHDAGEKVVLGVRLAAGRGIEDGEQVLDIVAAHPSTAQFIATKLARRFVSDSPPGVLVERAARTFTRTNGDIRETVRTIVTSPEFFSRAAYRAKVKSPFELVVSALRAVRAAPDTTPRTAQVIATLGQPLFLHQAPNGYPETGAAWINAGSILNRINFGLALASGRVPGASPTGWPGADTLARSSRAEQVDGVIRTILGGEASPDTRRILESGVNPMLTDSSAPRLSGVREVLGLALGAPEFQRR